MARPSAYLHENSCGNAQLRTSFQRLKRPHRPVVAEARAFKSSERQNSRRDGQSASAGSEVVVDLNCRHTNAGLAQSLEGADIQIALQQAKVPGRDPGPHPEREKHSLRPELDNDH